MKYYLIFLVLIIKLFLSNGFLFAENTQNENIKNIEIPDDIILEKEPVVVFRDTLFYIKTHIGSITAAERAANLVRKIENLYKDNNYKSEKLKVVVEEENHYLIYNDAIVININPAEAEVHNKTQRELAFEVRQKIIDVIAKHRKETNLRSIITEIALTLLLIISTFFAIKLINKLHKILTTKIFSLKGTKIKGISIKSYSILNEKQELKIILSALRIFKYIVIILLAYLFLPILFSIFPATQGIADTLFGYIINPIKKIFSSVLNYIPNLITIIIIAFVFRYILKLLKFFSREIKSENIKIKGFYPDLAVPTFNIIRFLLIAFMAVIIFPYLPG